MPHTAATISRVDQVDAVATAISETYDTAGRIIEAQMTMEFEEGIVVALDVMADFVSDLHLLMDFHGQDFDALLLAAQAKYEAHQEAVAS
jgi:hypothetical protein